MILIGGGSRVPRVQEILSEFVGRELGKNMNTDESAAMGAVYKAADLSTGKLTVYHGYRYCEEILHKIFVCIFAAEHWVPGACLQSLQCCGTEIIYFRLQLYLCP